VRIVYFVQLYSFPYKNIIVVPDIGIFLLFISEACFLNLNEQSKIRLVLIGKNLFLSQKVAV